MVKHAFNSIFVVGPTASGKTRLGVQLAAFLNGEILSADSRQVYRGLDIGSGKDLSEYAVDGSPIPYHLIDIADLSEEFSVFHFQQAFYRAFEEVKRRGKLPVVVGGTGLYLDAVLCGYQMVEAPENSELRRELTQWSDDALRKRLCELKPRQHNETDSRDRSRMVRAIEIAEFSMVHPAPPAPEIRPAILVLLHPPEILRQRIMLRLQERICAGLIEEVAGLHGNGIPWSRLESLGLEYRFVAQYLQGVIKNKNDLVQKLGSSIAQFAKRQRTWFRGMERRGHTIHWLPDSELSRALALLRELSEEQNTR